MGSHYDKQREARDDKEREENLALSRPTIVPRLRELTRAMRTVGLIGAGLIEEAIEHLESKR